MRDIHDKAEEGPVRVMSAGCAHVGFREGKSAQEGRDWGVFATLED
jgi:hypothetical protein